MNACVYEGRLSAYLDRALSATETSEVARHVAGCRVCTEEVQVLLNLKEVLRSEHMPAMPADLRASIEAETIFKPRWWETEAFRSRWAPTMLGAVAAGLAAWFWTHQAQDRPVLQQAIPVVQVPANPAPYQRPPTDRVALNADTPPQDNPLQ